MAGYSAKLGDVGGDIVTCADHQALLNHVFPENLAANNTSPLTFDTLAAYLNSVVSDVDVSPPLTMEDTPGRLGPAVVQLDMETNVGGQVLVEANRLGVTGHSNFSTIRANCCVFTGRWVFEVQLASKGVMQLGWCTRGCLFAREKGVGDTPDSYAYDGARNKKWNVNSLKYGESWLSDDVISCGIDCDKGTLEFFRNGVSLGVAFSDIRLGPGLAYFPAISLSHGEIVTLNFGATPLMYTYEGYSPLQSPPVHLMARSSVLFGYWERLLPMTVDSAKNDKTSSPEPSGHFVVPPAPRSLKATCWIIASHILKKLEPLLKDQYIFEHYMLPFLLKFCDTKSHQTDQSYVHTALQMIWAFFHNDSVQSCMTYLTVAILTTYRYSPVIEHFHHQRVYLHLMLATLKHLPTKNYLLRHVINMCTFDQVRFPIIFHPKPPGHSRLTELVPTVWWHFPMTAEDADRIVTDKPPEALAYEEAVRAIRRDVDQIEDIQVEILKAVLQDDDISPEDGVTSRTIFCKKFREFLQENFEQQKNDTSQDCPAPVILCFFHRLVKVVNYYWNILVQKEKDLPAFDELFLPIELFCLDKVDYFDVHRLGGMSALLKKIYKDEITSLVKQYSHRKHEKKTFFSLKKVAGLDESRDKKGKKAFRDRAVEEYLKLERCQNDSESPGPSSSGDKSPGWQQSGVGGPPTGTSLALTSLLELVDGIVVLYHLGAHKQLNLFAAVRESTQDYLTALKETNNKIDRCPENRPDIRETLVQARETFQVKLSELSRYMAWILAVVYSEEKRKDVFWILRVLLATFGAARREEKLYTFLPDFYVETCISSYQAIKSVFHPSVPMNSLPGCTAVFTEFSSFLVRNVSEERIANGDMRDNVLQCLVNFVCTPATLRCLEAMPAEDCEHFLRCLLAPYGSRAWAQTNWILARLWKGCGFAFRYTHLPHLTASKDFRSEPLANLTDKPCPSPWYQTRIQTLLTQDTDTGNKFIDSVLNRMKWAFSEVVGSMQELEQLRPIRQADHRHVRMCGTCFDVTVGLLRVLEMTIHLVPGFFLDWQSRHQSEFYCARLFSTLCQILNRITARKSLFDSVLSAHISGLENVDRFPILTAVAGILLQMIMRGSSNNRRTAVKALLTEPSFQMSSLEYFLPENADQEDSSPSGPSPSTSAATSTSLIVTTITTDRKVFSLRKYEEVSADEIAEFSKMIVQLKEDQTNTELMAEVCSEDDLCTICCAHAKSAVFKPCGHQSCKSCITYQMMSKPECFFCKANIKRVEDFNGKEIRTK